MRRRISLLLCFTLLALSLPVFVAFHGGSLGATTPKPNLVLILSDDQSIDSLVAMPFLRSKPGGHWVEFPNGLVNTPLCCPTRATLLSGLYPHHHGVEENNGGLFDDSSTLATWLQSAGYRTGLSGKYLNDYPFGAPFTPPGWSDFFANIDTTGYYNYQMYDNGNTVSYGSTPADYHTDVVAAHADSFIRSTPSDEPLFLMANPIAPHAPIIPAPRHANAPFTVTRPPNFNEADVSDKPTWVQSKPLMTAKQALAQDKERIKSYRAVLAIDDLVAKVYAALEDTGRLDDTVIVVMTDNGFLYGEHRASGKNCVYEECLRTPMYVRYPWSPGRVDPSFISSIDIAPTFAHLAGLVPPDPVDGTSMVPLLDDAAAPWRTSTLHQYAASSDRPPFWAIRNAQWKYVELNTGERELYDMAADPYELQNRANDPALADTKAALAAELLALRTAPPHMVLPSLSVSDVQVGESDTTAAFTVSLDLESSQGVSVTASTADGSATTPEDYLGTVQTLTFPPGTTSQTFNAAITNDAVLEGEESFAVTLSSPSNATIADAEATGVIVDDDQTLTPALSIDDVATTEGDAGTTTSTFTVSLSPAADSLVTVSYTTADGTAAAPDDYTAVSGSLNFEPGETSKSVSVDILGDEVVEADESYTVALSDAVGADLADASGTGTIVNDDVVVSASIDDVTVTEGSGGTTTATFTVSLSPAPEAETTVTYGTADGTASAPADYSAASGSVSFAAGETSKTVAVNVVGDALDEATESFAVSIASTDVAVADGTGVGSIVDDDPPPSIVVSDVSIVEGNSGTAPVSFTVTLSAASGMPVSVAFATIDATAKAPGDYLSASGTLTFAPGETVKTIQVSVVGDLVVERLETFTVSLSSPSGVTISDGIGKCTILDGD